MLSFRMEGEIKSFQDRQTERTYDHQAIPTRNIKGDTAGGQIPRVTDQKVTETIYRNRDFKYNGTKFIAFNTYSECKCSECSNKKTNSTRLDFKSKTYPYVVYNRLGLNLKPLQIESEGMKNNLPH